MILVDFNSVEKADETITMILSELRLHPVELSIVESDKVDIPGLLLSLEEKLDSAKELSSMKLSNGNILIYLNY